METVDVIVIGSGVAGLTTALVANMRGLHVVVLEKTGLIGGATAYASGGAFLPGCHVLPPEPDPAAPLRYLEHCTHGRMNRDLVNAYLANGPKALAALEQETEVRFQVYNGVDYRMNVPGASLAPRTVMPVAYDGRALGKDLKLVRPPLPATTLFGGMQVDFGDIVQLLNARHSLSSTLYAARLIARHVIGTLRYARSPRLVFGNALVGRLFKSVRDRQIDVRLHIAADELIVEDGVVTGVRTSVDGEQRNLLARSGVMLATGGFPGNTRLRHERARYPDLHKSLAPPTNTGDGIAMAQRAGAVLTDDNFSDYCLTPVSFSVDANGSERLFPHFAFDRCKPGAIAVAKNGRRFVNEGIVYSDFVPAMYAADAVPAYLICDARFLRKYGFGMVRPAPFPFRHHVRSGYLIEAPSLDSLADTLGIDRAGLRDSVSRNNVYALTGDDLDFGKGSDPYSASLGDPDHHPNPCLGPIAQAPFYALKLYPGETATTCGLAVNANAQVLRADGQAIPGLYAAGPDMANPAMGTNPSGGLNIGPALTFGYLAAEHMAARRSAGSRLAGAPDGARPLLKTGLIPLPKVPNDSQIQR